MPSQFAVYVEFFCHDPPQFALVSRYLPEGNQRCKPCSWERFSRSPFEPCISNERAADNENPDPQEYGTDRPFIQNACINKPDSYSKISFSSF